MKPRLFSLPIFGAACALALGVAVRAADDDVQALSKEQLAQFDKGPNTIDVSGYPAGLRDDYAVFRQRCSVCHTIARPINCSFVLPDEWSRYIKRMMHKPGSGINPGQAKKIYEFLAYDSSVRKKAMYDEKYAKADDAAKADADSRLKAILEAYPTK
jgi:hypothetical protein